MMSLQSWQSMAPIRSLLLLPMLSVVLMTGCQGATEPAAPFTGHWRMYEDPQKRFVTFESNSITLGDPKNSRKGTFTFELTSDQEPLYQVEATFPDGKQSFQLYYERDTIDLLGDERIQGMYEIIIQVVPAEG